MGPNPGKPPTCSRAARPKDGRYGENPNRLQHYYQFQVVLKPAPGDILELYLGSLEALGFDLKKNDIRFVEDDWENPTLGAWGLGWEVWLNGMEVTQFTYFQQVGGIDCKPATGEITYGLERLAMYLQGVDNVYDLCWTDGLSYGDVYKQNEVEQSTYNFEHADAGFLFAAFTAHEKQAQHLMQAQLALPAYEQVLKAAHSFNLLDARGAISVTERAALHRPHPQPGPRRGAQLLRKPRAARVPDGAARVGGANAEEGGVRRLPPVASSPQIQCRHVYLHFDGAPPWNCKFVDGATASPSASRCNWRVNWKCRMARPVSAEVAGPGRLRLAGVPGFDKFRLYGTPSGASCRNAHDRRGSSADAR